jgi:hypothetical protein
MDFDDDNHAKSAHSGSSLSSTDESNSESSSDLSEDTRDMTPPAGNIQPQIDN